MYKNKIRDSRESIQRKSYLQVTTIVIDIATFYASKFLSTILRIYDFFFLILQLHLNPIHAVLQLRPSMEHLKAGGSIGNNDAKSNVDFTVKSEEFDEQEPITSSKKQVTIMLLSSAVFIAKHIIVCIYLSILGSPPTYQV